MKILNLNQKRVCDLSDDKKVIRIRKGDCVTYIHANRDGTLSCVHRRVRKEK